MKRSATKITLLLLGFFMLALMFINDSEAKPLWPRLKGEVCLQGQNGTILRIFVTNMGNKHYIVNGSVNEENANIQAMVGSAEVKDGKVYITFTSTGSNDSHTWTSTGNAVLDASTLNGTAESMDIDHDKSNADSENATVSHNGPETLTRITCP